MRRFRAKPYARALLDVVLAEDADRLETAGEELDRLAAAVTAVPELERAMITPALPLPRKHAILDAVLDRLGIEGPVRRLARVLQRHYRLGEAGAVAAAYRELVDRHLGRVRATVEVAGQVDDTVRRRLVEALAAVTGEQVVAEFHEVPELLAGFRVRIGSKVYDASVRAQLGQMRRAAEAAQG